MSASPHRLNSQQPGQSAYRRPYHNPGKLLRVIFAGAFGAFLGLTLLKFGNPPIMEKWVTTPANIYEFMFGYPWPISWAWCLLVIVVLLGLFCAKWNPHAPRWLLVLPLIWFGWQCVAATQSLDPELTRATLKHFAVCILCFYLGLFSLPNTQHFGTFVAGIFCGFTLVLAMGIDQHFGGLAEYRRAFFEGIYVYHHSYSPEFLKKISSDRIFSTLFYPNVLAGVVLLLFPVLLAEVRGWRDSFRTAPGWLAILALVFLGTMAAWLYSTNSKAGLGWFLLLGLASLTAGPKWFLALILGSGSLATLYWSGSKGGWLLMLFLGSLALLRLPLAKKFKLVLALGVLVAGLTGFFWKYSGFFQKGATSVSARFDYWRAALQTTKAHPLFGTGPGTFFIAYEAVKRPESEPSRLVHNDFLEQASDSGLVGFLSYATLIIGALAWTFKTSVYTPKAANPDLATDVDHEQWRRFAVWLGLLGWSLQSLGEFGLYIPAVAWLGFAFFGWLIATSSSFMLNRIDTPASAP